MGIIRILLLSALSVAISSASSCSLAISNVASNLSLVRDNINKDALELLPSNFETIRDIAQQIENECEDVSIEVPRILDQWELDCEISTSSIDQVIKSYEREARNQKGSEELIVSTLSKVLALIPLVEKTCGIDSKYTKGKHVNDIDKTFLDLENFVYSLQKYENIDEEVLEVDDAIIYKKRKNDKDNLEDTIIIN